MLEPKVSEIITDFLNDEDKNYKDLRNNLSHYQNIFQYVYSNVFPEIYFQPRGQDSTLKAISTLSLKLPRTRKN